MAPLADLAAADNAVIAQLSVSSGGQFKSGLSVSHYGKIVSTDYKHQMSQALSKKSFFHRHLKFSSIPQVSSAIYTSPSPIRLLYQQPLPFHLFHLAHTGADAGVNRLVFDLLARLAPGQRLQPRVCCSSYQIAQSQRHSIVPSG